MFTAVIDYFIVAGIVVTLAQLVTHIFVSIGESLLKHKVLGATEEERNRCLDAFLQRNAIARIIVRTIALVVLRLGSVRLGEGAGSWRWLFWRFLAYYLSGLLTLPQDLVCRTNPAEVRENLS
jgi:hypothetical protein